MQEGRENTKKKKKKARCVYACFSKGGVGRSRELLTGQLSAAPCGSPDQVTCMLEALKEQGSSFIKSKSWQGDFLLQQGNRPCH